MFHVKRTVTHRHIASAICYKTIAEAIYKTLKDKRDAEKESK